MTIRTHVKPQPSVAKRSRVLQGPLCASSVRALVGDPNETILGNTDIIRVQGLYRSDYWERGSEMAPDVGRPIARYSVRSDPT